MLTLSDLRGLSRLAVDATLGVTGVVEAMHHTITCVPGILGEPVSGRTAGITGLVYGSVRGVTRAVGLALDAILAPLASRPAQPGTSPAREHALAALNGLLGDYLAATANPLAIPMRLRRDGQALDVSRAGLAAALPNAGGKIMLLVHGLCLDDLQWRQGEHSQAEQLAADLGYTAVYLHYNTGLHVSTNGRALADLLESLLASWPAPVEELVIVGHSMGGLVARSACHYAALAGRAWPRALAALVFLGTPHHGAPLERLGSWVDAALAASPYTAMLARLGKIRSAGITDLRHGSLLDDDWQDADRFARGDRRRPVPLPPGVRCHAVAVTAGTSADALRSLVLGDGLVPLASALGRHSNDDMALPFPDDRRWVGHAMHHLDLLHSPEVYAQVRRWLAPDAPPPDRGSP